MRQAPTYSEAALWRALRASQLGVVFRRQVPVLGFIVDFLAPAQRLVIEVDGAARGVSRAESAGGECAARDAGGVGWHSPDAQVAGFNGFHRIRVQQA
jgi:very-short-patch-repair endonuclease